MVPLAASQGCGEGAGLGRSPATLGDASTSNASVGSASTTGLSGDEGETASDSPGDGAEADSVESGVLDSGDDAGETTGGNDATTGDSSEATEGDGITDSTGSAGADGSSGSSGAGGGESETGNPDAPGPVEELRALPTNAAVFAQWELPDAPDLAGAVVARAEGVPVQGAPVDGTSYTPGDVIGNAEIIFATDGTNLFDAPLTNGVNYHYRVWVYDLDHHYSIGAVDDATPVDALPSGFGRYGFSVGGTIDAMDVAFDEDGHAHVALLVEGETERELVYATCDDGCDDLSDWTRTVVDTGLTRRPSIALDAQGRPRIGYDQPSNTAFARCDVGCTAAGNWSRVSLPDTSRTETSVHVDSDGRTWVAGGARTTLSWCDNGCSSPSSWSTIELNDNGSRSHEFVSASNGMKVVTTSVYEAQYRTRLFVCEGPCESPEDWQPHTVATTSGSVYSFHYRFTGDERGMRGFSPYQGGYYECRDCAPEVGAQIQVHPLVQRYGGSSMRLTPDDQPRLFTQTSSSLQYMVCDYDCETDSQWRTQNADLASVRIEDFRLDERGLPIAVGRPYSNATYLVVFRGL